jgi:homoserine kinase
VPTPPADHVTIDVPGSSANLGPGFDCLGVALPLRLRVQITRRAGPLAVRLHGEGADDLPADRSNLVVATMLGDDDGDGLDVEIANDLPLAAGCGSSAAAIVAGLAARAALAGRPVDRDELVAMAVAVEGHPDNIAAAVYGGFTIASGDPPLVRRIEPPRGLGFVLAVPPERLATSAARAALTEQALRADAVHNVQRVALLVSALYTGRLDDLAQALSDRLHQDARAHLVPTFARLATCSGRIGALGVTLSGAGPSVLVWCRADEAEDCAACVRREAPDAVVHVLAPEPDGLLVTTG